MRVFEVRDIFKNISMVTVRCPISCPLPIKNEIVELISDRYEHVCIRVELSARHQALMYPPFDLPEISIKYDFVFNNDPSDTDVSSFT